MGAQSYSTPGIQNKFLFCTLQPYHKHPSSQMDLTIPMTPKLEPTFKNGNHSRPSKERRTTINVFLNLITSYKKEEEKTSVHGEAAEWANQHMCIGIATILKKWNILAASVASRDLNGDMPRTRAIVSVAWLTTATRRAADYFRIH